MLYVFQRKMVYADVRWQQGESYSFAGRHEAEWCAAVVQGRMAFELAAIALFLGIEFYVSSSVKGLVLVK